MTVITTLAIVLIVAILASVMVINAYGPGRYKDPVVASHVVRGTIHDRNGRILAMEVPANNLYIKAPFVIGVLNMASAFLQMKFIFDELLVF